MKYLKLYEEIDNESEINRTLREICLELKDEGYYINFTRSYGADNEFFGVITIGKRTEIGTHQKIAFSDVKEYLLRMKDYLGYRYIKFRWHRGYKWETIELNDNICEPTAHVLSGIYLVEINYINK